VYHRGANGGTNPEQYNLYLNLTAAQEDFILFDDTAPTATNFTVGGYASVNGSGHNYVAYLFAHNDGDGGFGPDGDADIIKCGSFNSGGSAAYVDVDLGWEPQYILWKTNQNGVNWYVWDTMRGIPTDGNDAALFPNTSGLESVAGNYIDVTSTGFRLTPAGWNGLIGPNYDTVYIAIRRGTKVPESATEVFDVSTRNASEPAYTSGFPVDFAFARAKNIANNWDTGSRLQQGKRMFTNLTNAEASNSNMMFDYQDGWSAGTGASTEYLSWMWKRAPGFFDVVAYTGNGVAGRTVSHNLGVAPELLIVKHRNNAGGWLTYAEPRGISKYLFINSSAAETDVSSGYDFFYSTVPTATEFTVNSGYGINSSGNQFIAYLFASLPGISKVGSYSGDGTDGRVVDCGFSSGARFILHKCTSHAGNWFLFDSERGIVAGNDPRLWLNATDAEVTNGDFIDPHSSGFIVNNTYGDLNDTGRDYIFYAIA